MLDHRLDLPFGVPEGVEHLLHSCDKGIWGILARQIVTSDGEEGGEVSNILVTADGQVEALLIKRGGALGLGGTQVAIPWDQIQLQGDQITVSATRDELRDMPEYQTE